MTEPLPTAPPLAPATAQPTVSELIDRLERAVFQRRTGEGVQLLLQLLQAMATPRAPLGLMPPPGTPEQRRAVYTRVAAMISALVCSPDFQIDLRQITHLCGRKPILESIFELSGYEGPFHLLAYHGARNPDGGLTLRANQVFVLSLFYSLDDLPEQLLQGVLQLTPDQLLPLMLGWFTAPFLHSAQGEINRRALIDGSKLVEAAVPTAEVLQAISSAWMHCSYADYTGKHSLKKALNEVWRRLCKMSGMKSNPGRRRLVDKPVILVGAERMMNGHAMHRSYAACLRQLKSRFHVVCMVAAAHYTPDTHDLFDDVLVLEGGVELKEIASRIVKLSPDVIYYPSLGMSDWTQALCNFRFAPIQLMTLGHPAPAMTDTMDYTLVQAGHGEAAWEFGSKVIERQAWGQFAPNATAEVFAVERLNHADGRFHIAVNSSLMKLSPRFLAMCERLEAESTRKLHFHFFASAVGVAYDRMHQIIERRFRHFTLEPSRRYDAFLQTLSGCELALSAFPFGNTNSTVDTCLMHIPTAAFVANEVLSIGDRDVLRMVGLPSWLVSDNDEDYFNVAMKLIHDDAARQGIVDQLKATDVWSKVFEPPRPEDATEFVDAMDWIYRNHEALQASSQHLIKVGEPIPA
jgi:HMW1C N-terminal